MGLKLYCDSCSSEIDLGLIDSGANTIQYLKRGSAEKELEQKTFCHKCFTDVMSYIKKKRT